MSGLRPLLFSACCTVLLTSCGNNGKDAPPPAGTVTVSDPRAAALYSQAQGADTAGDTKKAIKLYEKTATAYPFSEIAPQARFRQAELLEHKEELIDAFDAYQDVIQRYPSSDLYTQARTKQSAVAYKAANGDIRNNFLGLKSKLDTKKIVGMLEKVRDNAPQSESAPKAQFTIAEVLQGRKKHAEATSAFEQVVSRYPNSALAPEAQYQIGAILLAATKGGNQNPANLDKARHAFEDLLQSYPNSSRAPDARKRVEEIGARDIGRSFDIAEFYYKKGQTDSAAFYYEEVLRKTTGGDMHDRATQRLAEIKGG